MAYQPDLVLEVFPLPPSNVSSEQKRLRGKAKGLRFCFVANILWIVTMSQIRQKISTATQGQHSPKFLPTLLLGFAISDFTRITADDFRAVYPNFELEVKLF